MANRKISELQSRTPALSDLMLVGDPSSGYSYKCTVTALATIIETDIADGFVTIGTTQTVSGAKTFSNNLTLTSVANTPTDPDKFLTLNASNVVTYRTGSQVLSDIGGASSSSISGTTNYIPKFTSSTAIGNSIMYESIAGIGVGLTSPSATFHVNGTGRFEGSLYASEAYLSSPNNIVGIIDSTNANGGFLQFSTSSTVIAEMGASQSVIGSGGNNLFALNAKGSRDLILATNATERVRIASTGSVTLSTIANATIDTDKFLVSDSGVIKYRTGAEVLSDIGGASSSSISGTTNYIPKFTSSSAIGNSVIYESSSNIGIGTTSPTYKLSVNGGIATTNDVTASTGSLGVLFGTASSALGSSDLGFIVADNNGYGSYNDLIISPRNNGAGNQGNLRVYTSGSERLRITSTGNVSMGTTTSAGGRLDVVSGAGLNTYFNSTGAGIYLQVANNGTNLGYIGDGSTLISGGGSTDFVVRSQAALAFSTNGNTERMRLDASGNLGLGVSPSAWDAANTKALQLDGGSFYMYGGDRVFLGQNIFFGSGGDTYVKSAPATTYRQYNGQHAWFNAASGTAGNAISFTQAMTLDASGNLGLGQTSIATVGSQRVFQIGATGGATVSHYDGASLAYRTSASSSGVDLFNPNNTNWAVYTNGSQRLTITGAGNVGIGITSPAAKLDVQTTSGTLMRVENPNVAQLNIGNGGTSTNYYDADLQIFRSGNGSERMRITSGGNVGIGSTNPSVNLVVSNAGAAGFEFNPNSAGLAQIETYNRTTAAYVGFRINADDIRFHTGASATERMRITSGGDLLVGATDNPQSARAHFKTSGGGTSISTISTQDSYIAARFLEADGDLAGYISVSTGSVAYNTSSDYRLKQDLKTFNGLSLIDSINVYDYQWKANNQRSYGVLAHELQSVIPYAVTGEKDGQLIQGVDYSKLVPVLVQAIKELKAELQILKNK